MFGKKKKKEELEKVENVNVEEELGDAKVDATDSAVDLPDNNEEKTEEAKPEEPKKKRKLIGAWDTFNLYKFIFEIVATSLLVALGFLILFNKNEAMFAIFVITGGVPLVTIIIRAIVLIRKRKDKEKKLIRFILVEFLIEGILAIAMIFAAIMCIEAKADDAETAKKIQTWFNDTFAYWATGLLYVSSISFFIRVIIFKEYTDRFKFWMNIVFITGAILLLYFKGSTDITVWAIAIIIAVLAFLCAAVLGTDAGGGYYNYYKRSKAKADAEKEKEEENKIEVPANESTNDVIINDIDSTDQDSDRIA